MNITEKNVKNLEWSIRVPIFKHSVILKQLGIAIGIPFGLLLIVFLLISNPENRIYSIYAFGIIILLFLLTYIFIQLVYRGKYAVSFILNEEGVQYSTQSDTVKKNRIVNGLVISLGLLSGKPTISGAGLLANSKQSVTIKWKNIKQVRYEPKQKTVMLRSSPLENIAVFCTDENYPIVETYIKGKLSQSDVSH
jgi:hypothetical protein